MHLNFGHFVLYTPIYQIQIQYRHSICICTNLSIKESKPRFNIQNCPCVTVVAKIGYLLGLLVHGKVVVEFGMKIVLVVFYEKKH